jgi:peptide/nickel transport system permease protein
MLTVTAVVLTFVVAVPVGLLSGLNRGSLLDRAVTALVFGGISVPSFFLCLMLLFVFSLQLKLFPTSGYATLGLETTRVGRWLDVLSHLVLPAIAVAVPSMAGIARFTRSSTIDVLVEDYVQTARAKGLREWIVLTRHVLKNALIPVVTLFGLQVPALFGGAYVVEYIFDWPGMGTLAMRSVSNREYSILMALNLVTAFLVLLGNLITDILYAAIDPRIRYD